MIHIDVKPEPAKFNESVRGPGQEFIRQHPRPTDKQWSKNNYWKHVAKELHSAYEGICAYSCHWISYDTGWRTVEHFLPKSQYPEFAYDWNNYRLVCGVLNSRKGTRRILDPFLVENGWFIIRFPSLLVVPAPELDTNLQAKVKETCGILGLNDEDTCMKTRSKYVEDYCRGRINFDHLRQEAPFLATELERQGLVERIKEIMIYS